MSNIIRMTSLRDGVTISSRERRPKSLAHDWSGYLLMPLALVLVGVEVLVLSWLAADSEMAAEAAAAARRPIAPVLPGQARTRPRQNSRDDI